MQEKRNSQLVRSALTLGLLLMHGCVPTEADHGMETDGDGGLNSVHEKAGPAYQYEAESRSSQQGCVEAANRTGYTGTGFMDFGGNGTWMEWNAISAQTAGVYDLTFRYANGSAFTRPSAIYVNGSSAGSVAFPATGRWRTWSTQTLRATLRQGTNTLRVLANTASGGPNLDHVVVTAVDACANDPAKTEPGLCGCGVPEGTCGNTTTCATANEGESVTLSCAGGSTIQTIKFASYGTPAGSCNAGFSNGICHAPLSLQQVQAACLGKQACSVGASNGLFDDPCEGTPKRLAVTYTCGGTIGTDSCPAPVIKPAISGCDGMLLTDASATEAQSSGIATTTGPAGAAALRIGDAQSIDIKDAGCLQVGNAGADFSLSMWLKPTSGTSQVIGTTSQYSMRQGFVLYTEDVGGGNVALHFASFGPGFSSDVASAPVVPGAWTHVVLRYDGSGGTATFSMDVNLARRTGTAAPNVYNDRLRIGDEGWGSIAPFEVSELRSYGRFLSDSEVKALFVDKAAATGASAATLRDAMTQLQGHVDGTSPLSASGLSSAAQRFTGSAMFLGIDAALIEQVFRLVATYETRVGPLFMTSATQAGVPRAESSGDGLQLARIMLKVQQAVLDQVFGTENVQACGAALLKDKRFRSADYFPGVAPPPTDPTKSYTVMVDATLRSDWGRPVMFSQDPVRRPTGLYLSPGSVAEVTVPQSMANAGFSILVGAHTADLSNKWILKRMDRVTTSFPITKPVMRVANPLGGGIYIVVPYLSNLGKVAVSVKNVIEAPFFSFKSWDKTSAAQWQARRTAPAPWADFESDKYMMQVPRSWIYASGDPTALMRNWDAAMDGVSELMGFPPDKRNRTVLYQQIDVIIRGDALAPGYAQVNNTYDPNQKETGNKDHWFLTDPSASDGDYHELGHAQLFSKFRGETEAAVNFLYAYVRSVKFGIPFDQAFRHSMGTDSEFAGYTPDDSAIHWMLTDNFRAGREMDYSDTEKDEFRYQQRGYAKYADIYRIFGWQPLRDFFYQEHLDSMSGTPSDGLDPVDSRILRLSVAAGADLTPLIHFWGIAPVNASALKQRLTQLAIPRSEAVRAHIARYKTVAPKNNADFNAHYERIYPGRPSGDNTNYGPGWYNVRRNSFNETHAAQIQAQIDKVLNLYYSGTSKTMPVFLMAGQSNMVGNVDLNLLNTLLSELSSGSSTTLQTRLKTRLADWYTNHDGGYASYGYSDAMATYESSELIRLKNAGLVDADLTNPLSNVMCGTEESPISGLTTNCGSVFGPELVLGHYLAANSYPTTSLIKVARGGTALYSDWRSPRIVAESGGSVGGLYGKLAARIDSLKSAPASVHPSCTSQSCRWAAFIWFQGENDCFNQANAQAYARNLTNLIADVRGQVGSSTLPVIVVEMGKWAQSLDYGSVVTAAQRSVVAADPYARIVKTDDLSGFYHYDPAAQLIIGERVGVALKPMLP